MFAVCAGEACTNSKHRQKMACEAGQHAEKRENGKALWLPTQGWCNVFFAAEGGTKEHWNCGSNSPVLAAAELPPRFSFACIVC